MRRKRPRKTTSRFLTFAAVNKKMQYHTATFRHIHEANEDKGDHTLLTK